jgi:hypothetical protein
MEAFCIAVLTEQATVVADCSDTVALGWSLARLKVKR